MSQKFFFKSENSFNLDASSDLPSKIDDGIKFLDIFRNPMWGYTFSPGDLFFIEY